MHKILVLPQGFRAGFPIELLFDADGVLRQLVKVGCLHYPFFSGVGSKVTGSNYVVRFVICLKRGRWVEIRARDLLGAPGSRRFAGTASIRHQRRIVSTNYQKEGCMPIDGWIRWEDRNFETPEHF